MTSTSKEPLRVCLERSVELEGARLRLRDWPGFDGPLVHVPDALSPGGDVINSLASELAPRYRVSSIHPRRGQPYQVQIMDILATLDQFGFDKPILVGERLGSVAAVLLAVWHPTRVARLVLIDATYAAQGSSVEARALRDCPPDWSALRSAVQCPVLDMRWNSAAVEALQAFVQIP